MPAALFQALFLSGFHWHHAPLGFEPHAPLGCEEVEVLCLRGGCFVMVGSSIAAPLDVFLGLQAVREAAVEEWFDDGFTSKSNFCLSDSFYLLIFRLKHH
jgi:hypothetical protein